jgi:hypothetical protein
MAGVFESLIQLMVSSGAYYIFIWLLFAAIIYGVLEKYDVLGESSANGGAALGASFFTLLGIFVFAPEGLFLNFGAAVGFIIMGIFSAVVLLSFSGINVPEMTEGVEGNVLAGASLILVLIAFLGALAFNMDWGSLLGSSLSNDTALWEDILFPIVFLVFLLIVILAAMDGGE